MTEAGVSKVVDIAKILSDETRVRILCTLLKHKEMCVYEIAAEVGVSHSAASHQLARLEDMGLVVCFRDGQRMCYELCSSKERERLTRFLKDCSV